MHLQRAVWNAYRPGQCNDMSPSEGWHIAADAAIQAVAQIEGLRSARASDEGRNAPVTIEGEPIEEGDLIETRASGTEFYNDRFWRLAHRLADACDDEIRENPYCIVYRALPTVEIRPEWFDRLVRRECGIEMDDPRRMEFVVWVVVDRARRNGHTLVPTRTVLDQLVDAAEVTFAVAVEVARGMVVRDLLRSYRDDGRSYLAVRSIDDAERSTARFLAERMTLEFPVDSTLEPEGTEEKDDDV